jgi:uncharacterized membrane protein YphA (DoxX/SURF4 family)
MRTNPFLDSLHFLIGDTPDHDALGPAKYILVVLYAALLAGSIAIAIRAWSRDPAQRTGRNAAIWLCRVLIGTMWLQGSLWKLPLPVSGGFRYWTGQLVEHSAFPAHAALIRDVFLANISVLDPLVYLTETLLAASLMLGFAVRLAGLVGIAFTLNLWIGLYHNDAEWPWQYVFIIMTHAFFALDHAGQALGLDALVRRARTGLLNGPSLIGRAYRLAS